MVMWYRTVVGRGVRGAEEIEEGELHKEWGHLHTFLKQGQIQRFALGWKRHHISTKDCLPQTVRQDPGPSETSGSPFSKWEQHLLPVSFLKVME